MQKVLIHYGELALKGGNRRYFERKLAENLRRLLGPAGIHRQFGRMLVDFEHVDAALLDYLALIPGIRNFAPIRTTGHDLDEIRETAEAAVLAANPDPAGVRFRVEARRAFKGYPLTSPEINFEVGGYLKSRLDLAVDLDHPELTVHVEVTPRETYVYTDKRRGVGGLPVGSSGRAVVLLSGGIDSPVASYKMMKRGVEVVLVHFYNSTINRDFAKIRDLARRLSRYQPRLKLYLVDLEEFQRHAIASVPARYRMVVYKRQMIRAAARIANGERAQALVTGDSLGQVASQTLGNIHAIYDVSELPLLSPLIADDKEEIIALARRIGTYDTSIEEYCDICSYLIAKHPETRATREAVAGLEAALPTGGLDFPTREERYGGGEPLA